MGDFDPYPTLLGIDWSFDKNVVLNLKKRHMSFETDTLHMIAPLDPNEEDIYHEPVDEDTCIYIIENIYKINGNREEYINPTVYGDLIW